MFETYLPGLRQIAESRMSSRCAVMRKTGETTPDEATGSDVPTWATVYPSAPFRLGGANQGSTGSRVVDVPGGELALALRVGHFPDDHRLLEDGDWVDVVEGESAGLVFRIVEASPKDQQTAMRVQLVEERRPEEWT